MLCDENVRKARTQFFSWIESVLFCGSSRVGGIPQGRLIPGRECGHGIPDESEFEIRDDFR